MSKSETLGGIVYIGSSLAAAGVIAVLSAIKSLDSKDFGQILLSPALNLSPDYLELLVQSSAPVMSISLQCFLLSVDSDAGVAFQLAYRWRSAAAASSPGLAAQRKLATFLVTSFDLRLKEAGAQATAPRPVVTVEGDSYDGISIAAATQIVSELVCANREIRDQSRALKATWHGKVAWLSPRTGTVAGLFSYRTPGGEWQMFMRWNFFKKDKQSKEIALNYECSAAGLSLKNKKSLEWDMIETLISQTGILLCKAGAKRIGQTGVPAKAPQSVAGNANPVNISDMASSGSKPDASHRTFWPMPHDFNESMQNLRHCVADDEIRLAELVLDQMGLPRVLSGNFACVYRVRRAKGDIAVRCFTSPVTDQAERYKRMSRFICSDDLPYTIDFHYLDRGILVKGHWYPIVKMEWIEGESLRSYIARHLSYPEALRRLRLKIAKMMKDLDGAGVAHGDLQHGNLIIRNNEIILVDYDGMYVPDLSGFKSKEKGHPNYQHPARGAQHFGPYLDHFSAWVIDTALLAIERDPQLFHRFGAGDESLLFRRSDFLNPAASELFSVLARHGCADLNKRAAYLRSLLAAPLELIPALSLDYPELLQPDSKESGLPDWML